MRNATRWWTSGLVAAVVGTSLALAGPAHALPPPDRSHDATAFGYPEITVAGALSPGETVFRDQALLSPDRRFALAVEPTGELTIYGPTGPIWAKDVAHGADRLVLQGDGNLVAYDTIGYPRWASSSPGAVLRMQDDGNAVVYRADGSAAWASGSSPSDARLGDRLLRGSRLDAGQSIASPDGSRVLVMQADGNLVVYGPGGPLWASGTGRPRSYAALRMNGDLVVYEAGNVPLWHSGTEGTGAASVLMQDDGNLVAYRPDARPVWASMSSKGAAAQATALLNDQRLAPGQSLTSPNGAYRLVMQPDGNLVVYGPRGPNWASATGVPNSSLAMRDGQIAIAAAPLARASWWPSVRLSSPNDRLTLQDDGNLVLYRLNGSAMWASLDPSLARVSRDVQPPPYGWW